MAQIDPDERRQKIAEAAFDVIAGEGLEAATIRRIAAELGVSTTAITHYFATKQELLAWTYRALGDRAHARFDATAERTQSDVVECMLAIAATDEAGIRHWRVYLAFWERAARDPVFHQQQGENLHWSLAEFGRVLTTRHPTIPNVEKAAKVLAALVQGVSVQVLLDKDSWTIDQIRALLQEQLDSLL